MKKFTLLALIAAALVFTACGEKTKEGAAKTAEGLKEDTARAVDSTKEALSNAAEKSKEAVNDMTDDTKREVHVTKDTEVEVKESATDTPDTKTAPAAYAKCKGCHGVDGKTKALGKSAVIAGQDKDTIVESLKAYKAGTRNVAGMGALMQGQVASMSDEDMEDVAEYLSSID